MNEDPLVEQMNNLRGYIQAAREANMLDEVSMLESNLKMLQKEFKRQKEDDACGIWHIMPNIPHSIASNPLSQVFNNSEIVVQ